MDGDDDDDHVQFLLIDDTSVRQGFVFSDVIVFLLDVTVCSVRCDSLLYQM